MIKDYRKEKKIILQDLLNLEFLQSFQDSLAKAMNIGCIILDNEKQITKPSNFSYFCSNLLRNNKITAEACNNCDLKWGHIAALKGEPVIYTCHAGLTDFAVPIIIENQHIGSILGGQILTEEPHEENYRAIAKRLGIDEEKYLEAVSKIKIVPLEKIHEFANLLFIVANMLSDIAHKNLDLMHKNKVAMLMQKVTETIRNSLDINETKQLIVNILGESLGADKCLIVEYDHLHDKLKLIKDEYLISKDIANSTNYDVNVSLPNFTKIILNKHSFIINEQKILTKYPEKLDFSIEEKYIKDRNIISAIAIPVIHNNELLGGLWVQYNKEGKAIENDELELVSIMTRQIATALYQSRMHQITQMQAEKEKICRNITEILTSSLDKATIRSSFIQNIGEYFNADRVLFCEYNEQKQKFYPADEHSEYLSSINEQSFIDYDWSEPSIAEFTDTLRNKKELNISRWEDFISKNHYSNGFIRLFEDAKVKSSYNIPILHSNKLKGFFSLDFSQNYKEFSNEDLELLRYISKQAGIALYHAELYDKAQESARSKGEFIANMSHEIKTPLNIIIGFSEIMSEMQLDRRKQVEYLNNINISGKHLLSLTNDIINISKIDAGKIELNYELFNIQRLIMDAINSIHIIAKSKNITIYQNIEEIEIRADYKMLTQVMYNLLNNAIKFTQKNGKVIVTAEKSNENLIVSIADTGIGISDENQGKIFEAFRQIDSSYAKKEDGAGLGLSITKKIIELHNGEIHVESEESKGSLFWFSIPTNIKNESLIKQLI